jgi:diguanylate cyclase (GGDEF)-like protein
MNKPPPALPYLTTLIIISILFASILFFPISDLLKLGIGAVLLLIPAVLILSYIKGNRNYHLVSRLYSREAARGRSLSGELLTELSQAGGTGRKWLENTAGLIREKFRLRKLVIFFRESDKYLPGIFYNFRQSNLNRPRAHKLLSLFGNITSAGMISSDESLLEPLFRRGAQEDFEKPVVYLQEWAPSRSVIVAADDTSGLLSDALSDTEFNRVFWPILYSQVSMNLKSIDSYSDRKRLRDDLTRAQKELSGINKELNKKLLDLNSFVRISGDFYSHFDEEQLFETLKKTVCSHLGAAGAEIMYRIDDKRFAIKKEPDDRGSRTALWIDSDTDLFRVIGDGKAVLLPVVGSGMAADDPFLKKAIGSGFQIATAIRIENKTAFILMVREKTDKSQYIDSNLDFLSIISNIASLALEKIRQYSTIEKLSYTDSMTGVYNYRYFYKRLNEEVLRAKRFNRSLALVILDIDNFKLFNDNYGHQTGDLVLKRLAEIITGSIRSIDVVSRYGGEEFCIIIPDSDVASCGVFIERLRSEIADFRLDSNILKDDNVITVSIGGAVYPRHAATPDRIIYCADMALLRAKAEGRNKAIMYQPDFVGSEESSVGERNEQG